MSESTVASTIHFIIDWIQARLRERTSWDGLTIIVISVMVLIASPFVRYAAWAGLIYGVWTLWKNEGWGVFGSGRSGKTGVP